MTWTEQYQSSYNNPDKNCFYEENHGNMCSFLSQCSLHFSSIERHQIGHFQIFIPQQNKCFWVKMESACVSIRTYESDIVGLGLG